MEFNIVPLTGIGAHCGCHSNTEGFLKYLYIYPAFLQVPGAFQSRHCLDPTTQFYAFLLKSFIKSNETYSLVRVHKTVALHLFGFIKVAASCAFNLWSRAHLKMCLVWPVKQCLKRDQDLTNEHSYLWMVSWIGASDKCSVMWGTAGGGLDETETLHAKPWEVPHLVFHLQTLLSGHWGFASSAVFWNLSSGMQRQPRQ